MEKLVSIIIVNYNKNYLTLECLESLTNQSYKNFEILLVDNGSKYQIYLQLKDALKHFNDRLTIKLIRSDLNLYFGAGNNKAIKEAKGEYICLLNFDTEVEPDFLNKMIDFLERNPHAGLISPKIKLFDDKNYIWNAGGDVNFRSIAVVTNRGYLEYDPDNQKYNTIEVTDFAAGTAVFVRKEYLEEIGLMDDIFFMYWEDPDWNFTAKKKGYESYYVPTTIVYHKIPINRDKTNQRFIFNDFFFKRNKQIFVWKHAKLVDLVIFYSKFIYYSYHELIKKLKKKEIKLFLLQLIASWQGFRIGIKRRFHRSCRRYMIEDFYFVKNLQKF